MGAHRRPQDMVRGWYSMARVIIAPDKLAAAYRYANLLQNRAKRQYTNAYIGWLHNGAHGLVPERGRLSYRAAQTVRMEIDAMDLWTDALI